MLEGVEFADASQYLSVPAGAHTFVVAPAGQGVGAAVITADATIAAGKAYTVAAIGQLANIEAKIFADNLAAPAQGKAHIRVLHLSPDAPAVDLKTQDNAVTLVSNLSYPNASDYLPVDATSYDLKVTTAGSTDTVLALDDVRLQAGTIYDFFALGLLASDLLVLPVSYTPSGTLPDTGLSEVPLGLLASVALVVLASGLVLRRRLA